MPSNPTWEETADVAPSWNDTSDSSPKWEDTSDHPADLSGIKVDPYQLASINPNRGPMDTYGPQTTDLTEALAQSIVPHIAGNPNATPGAIASDLALSPLRVASMPFQFLPHQVMDTVENVAADVGNIPFIGMGMNPPFEPGKQILPKAESHPDSDIYNQLAEMTTPGNVALAGVLHKAGPAFDYARANPPSFELARQLDQAPLPPEGASTEPIPENRLGVQVPPNPFFNPGVKDLASRAIEEAQNRAVLQPGAEPALATLRRAIEPPILQQVINASKAEPLGGQVSFAAPAEAEAIPNARQSAIPFFDRESEAQGLGRPSTAPTIEDVRAQREREANASTVKGAEPLSEHEVRARMGEGTPLRQQPEATPGAQERLTPDEIRGENATKATIDKWSALTAPEFDQTIKEGKLGVTSSGYRLAENLTADDIPALEEAKKNAHAQRKALSKAAKTPDEFAQSMALGLKGQMFDEAIRWRKALDEAKAIDSPMREHFADLETKYGVGESRRYGEDLKEGLAREQAKAKPISEKEADIAKFDELNKTRNKLIAEDKGFEPEGIKVWKQLEEIKNKYGGMPPAEAENAVSLEQLKEGPRPFDKSTLKTRKQIEAEKAAQAEEPQVESVTALDKASGSPLSATDSLIQRLGGLKFAEENQGRLYSLPHPDAIAQIGKTAWNNGIDVAIAAVKAGRSIKEAIDEAIKYIKKNAKGFDEAKIRANLDSLVRSETKSDTGVPKAEQRTKTPNPVSSSLADVYKIFEPEKKQGSSIKEKAVNFVEAIRTGLSSKFRPLNKLAEDIARASGRSNPKDIAGIMEQLKGSRGRGEADVYRFDKDVSDLVKGKEKDFNAYMFLRRSLDRLNQDIASGESRRSVANFTPESLTAKLDALKSQLGPETTSQFEKAAQGYQDHMDKALRLQVESGRMSQEVYNAIKSGNQFYAPFKVMKYLEETSRPEGTGAKIDTVADFTKAMKGIEDPNFKLGDMLSAGRQSLLISRILADKNLAMRNVAELAPFDTEGRFIKKLGPTEQPPKGMGTVNVMEDGKVQKYATNQDVADALQIYQGGGENIVSKLLSLASIPFKAGATALNLPFQVSNLLADVPRQALVSKYGLRGVQDLIHYPMDFVHAALSSVFADVFGARSKLFEDFLDSGAAGVTVQEHLTPKALQFQEPTAISKSRRLANTVLNTLPRFSAAIEQTSKVLGVKRAMRMEGVESGAQLAKQIPEAITEIRRFSGSPDFGRQGKWVEQARLNLIYMFLNARIQGAVADVGRLTGRDGAGMAAKTWFKVGTAVGIPTAYLWALNNRPEYKDDYDKRSQQEKQNYWLIPKDTYITNEDGEKMRDYWRIPKRESSKWIANLSESALNFAQKRDGKAVTDWANMMLNDISPVNVQGNTAQERMESVVSSLNPLIKAPLEVATGRDTYRHRDLIPDSQKKASPELQYTDRTPEVFKKLAEKMPDVAPEFLRSPIILDNLTRSLTAGLITQFLPHKPVEGRTGIENTPLLQRFQALPYTDQEQFRTQMQSLERESADETLTRFRAVNKLLEDNKGKPLSEIVGQAPKDEKFLRHLVDVWVAKQNGATSQDRQLLALPAKQRAAYITDQLQNMTPDQKNKAILDFARKRVLTEAVAAEMVQRPDSEFGGRPIDTNRPIIHNPDGSISTERTMTIESDGKFILIPTIVNGKQLSQQDAIKEWKAGNNKPVGVFKTNEEAEKYATERSKEIGRLRQ